MINLPHARGVQICPEALAGHFVVNRLPYLRIGKETAVFDNLRHTDSLDFWIRSRPAVMQHRDVMQAVNQVVDELCETGYFKRTEFRNDKNQKVNAIRCTIPPAYFDAHLENAA